MTLVKADGSSFAAGTYTITITDVEDEYGNASEEDLEAEVTKDNSYAVGFKAYEGYVAEYDTVGEIQDGDTVLRYVHVSVTDQYGEEMDSALSSTYGTVTVKAHIKSNNSIIAARFNKSGAESTVDGKDMAYVTLTADKDFKAGETVVIDLVNKVDGVEYPSTLEAEIIGYDLVQTAQVVTEMTVTTDKTADISKTWTDDGKSGSMTLSTNNKVFLIVSALDSNGIAAKKGNIKFVSSDPTVVKVGTTSGAKFGETAITSKLYDTDGTIIDAIVDDDDAFGVWLEGQKAGTATITAYATGFIDNAYTFDVEITEAALTISDAIAYVGEKAYFPITKTDGIKHATLTPVVTAMYAVDEDGTETQVTTPTAGKYLGTASAADKDLGLKEGVSYLTLTMNSADQELQANYKALVSVSSGTVAKSEETEVTLSPRIEVDGDKKAGSGIYFGCNKTTASDAANDAIHGPAVATGCATPQGTTLTSANASVDTLAFTQTSGYKGVSFYKTINVINTTPIKIGNYAASQIKYAWSDDTKGSAKVDISSDFTADTTGTVTGKLQTNGVALLTITPKTDELIGTLTLSIGGATKDLTVKLGKLVSGASLEAEVQDGSKAVLLAAGAGPTYNIENAEVNKHEVVLTIKDQYDSALAGLTLGAADGTTALRLKNAPQVAAGAATIAGELTATLRAEAGGTYNIALSAIYPGTHSLTFYIGDDANEVGEDDPQVTVDLTYVQYKDLTSIVPQSSVKWTADNGGTSDWDHVVGKFGDAATTTSGAVAAGMFLDTKADSTITPSAKVYAGDVEVANVPITWSILDNELSFTETWIASVANETPAGSQTVSAVDAGAAGSWATTDGTDITINVDGDTGFTLPTTDAVYNSADSYKRVDDTVKGDWNTGAGGDDLDDVLACVAGADSGESATLYGTIHLNANVAGTDLDAQSYIHLSNAGMSVSVDDMYLVYPARNDVIGVKSGEKVADSVKVKAGNVAGTKLRVIAVDSTYGAELYDESVNDRFVVDGATAANLIVGADSATVVDGNGATTNVTNGVITVTAATDTAGKTASLRIEIKSGAKSGIITVPLEIIS